MPTVNVNARDLNSLWRQLEMQGVIAPSRAALRGLLDAQGVDLKSAGPITLEVPDAWAPRGVVRPRPAGAFNPDEMPTVPIMKLGPSKPRGPAGKGP